MKPVRWTPHALHELAKREVDRDEVDLTLRLPDAVIPATPVRTFFQRRYLDHALSETMLLRVLVEETEFELVIVTLYKTSKLQKYETGSSL
ncbi:MAG: hypothetical protein RLZZ350_338 [Verrucomicrobiota bacterium]|jgi:hypothetical protein